MNSLHASRAGTATFRLLKTSPINNALIQIYNFQRVQSNRLGQNTITIEDKSRGDKYTLQGCAFVRMPTNSYAKVGNTIEWEFHVSLCDVLLGNDAAMAGGQGGYFGSSWAVDTPVATIARDVGLRALGGGRRAVGLTALPPSRARAEMTRGPVGF